VAKSDAVKDSNKKNDFLQQLVLGKGLGFWKKDWPCAFSTIKHVCDKGNMLKTKSPLHLMT
jgi:hypothetical protein